MAPIVGGGRVCASFKTSHTQRLFDFVESLGRVFTIDCAVAGHSDSARAAGADFRAALTLEILREAAASVMRSLLVVFFMFVFEVR